MKQKILDELNAMREQDRLEEETEQVIRDIEKAKPIFKDASKFFLTASKVCTVLSNISDNQVSKHAIQTYLIKSRRAVCQLFETLVQEHYDEFEESIKDHAPQESDSTEESFQEQRTA